MTIGKNNESLFSGRGQGEGFTKLNKIAREKLGIKLSQKNVLVRITLRDLNRTLTKEEANKIYEEIYKKVNYGSSGY